MWMVPCFSLSLVPDHCFRLEDSVQAQQGNSLYCCSENSQVNRLDRQTSQISYQIIFNFIDQNMCCRVLRLQSFFYKLVVISFGLERHRVSLDARDSTGQLECMVC